MLSEIVLVLTVASLAILVTNGHINPYFACRLDSYDILQNEGDEIVLDKCGASATNEIMDKLRRSRLRGRPLHLNTFVVNFTALEVSTVVDLDFSEVGLSALDLRNLGHLSRLNLTSNKFHSFNSIQMRDNLTLDSIDMSYNRLNKLKSNAILSTRRLYLRSNTIMELEANLTLPEALLELDLTRNEIESLSQVAFSSPQLKILNLSINLINAISNTTFAQLPALQILILKCNKITDIQTNTFDHNNKLVQLNLRDNNLSTLEKGVFESLLNLQLLDVSKNRLLHLTLDNVRELNNLVHFSLSENTELCQNQCEGDLQFLLMLGAGLKVLRMGRLRLKTFPVTLTTSIRTLDLSANKLTSIQTGDLENFPFLEVLDLNSNLVDVIEKDVFFRMEYLQELYLHNNHLEKVPSLLPQSLRVLRIDNNRVRTISRMDFHNLSKLSTLTLNSNSIVSIESDAFSWLSGLRFLDISHNPIQHLRTDTFEGPINLNTLQATNLSTVCINATDPRYFPISELPNLRYLNLSRSASMANSFLRDYPLLTTVRQLEVLDLDNANLTRVPWHLQRFLPRLRLLSLRGNMINCSDNSFSEWKEPYRLETPLHHTTDHTDLKVRVTRLSIHPSCNRVIIQSPCSFSTNNCTITSKENFWSSILPLGSTTTVPPISFFEPKLTSGLWPDETIIANTIRWDDSTTASTQMAAKLPNVVTSTHSVYNSTTEGRTLFFDWLPSLNDSTADRSRASDPNGSDDGELKNTHPGLIIFLFVSVSILLGFGSLITPPCLQTRIYIWRRRQHRGLQPRLEQPSIEVSSISAFIDCEMCLD